MTVSVVLPWSDLGCPHRERARDWVLPRWQERGFQVLLGETSGPWCKARAVADAVPRVTGDVVIVADADCWSENIEDAVRAVEDGAAWAMPHRSVRRLSPEATARVLAGDPLSDGHALAQPPYQGWSGGGIVVVPRRTYYEVPLDTRFVGWSGEDESWALALTTLAGSPWRGSAPLWHLWHPPQERMSRRWGSNAARELAMRYQRAARSPARMRALLDEMPRA